MRLRERQLRARAGPSLDPGMREYVQRRISLGNLCKPQQNVVALPDKHGAVRSDTCSLGNLLLEKDQSALLPLVLRPAQANQSRNRLELPKTDWLCCRAPRERRPGRHAGLAASLYC